MVERKRLLVAGWILLALAAGCAGGGADRASGVLDVIDASAGADADGFTDGRADAPATPDADASPAEIVETDAGSDVAIDSDGAGACTRQGFEVVTAKAETSLAAEGGFLYLAAADSQTAPASVFGLELLLDVRATGPYDFTDENYATCERCARIDADCAAPGDCGKIFLVYAGHMDISAWDDPGGHFTATFTDLRAREVTIANELPMTSTPVEGGETWCVDTIALDVAPLTEM